VYGLVYNCKDLTFSFELDWKVLKHFKLSNDISDLNFSMISLVVVLRID
jgi:hypothetical protein